MAGQTIDDLGARGTVVGSDVVILGVGGVLKQSTVAEILKEVSVSNVGSLSVSGASTLTGAVSASSTLSVTGATTLSSTLVVAGAATLGATAGSVTVNTSADDLVVQNSANSGISILSPDANNARLNFGCPSDPDAVQFIGQYNGGTQILQAFIGGTETIRAIAGKIAVGPGSLPSPDGTLHVHTASAGTIFPVAGADDLVVENSGDAGITILAGNANVAMLAFGDDGDADRGNISYHHNTNLMKIASNGSHRMRFESSIVGVSVGSDVQPDGTFHVHTATAGAVTASADADDLVVENSGDAGITILSGASNDSSLYFGDSGDNDIGSIKYDHADNSMLFTVNAGVAFRIASNQDIRLSASTSALATSVTGGFPGMPTMAGDPAGTPANASAGNAAFCFDSTNNQFKIYDPIAAAWYEVQMVAQ